MKDNQVQDFTDKAKNQVGKEAQKYAKKLITEAKSCEQSQREQGADCVVTDNHVLQAKQKMKLKKKRPWWWYVINIITQILMFVMGFLCDLGQLVNAGQVNMRYLINMIFLLIVCIAGIFVSNIFGGE